MPEDTKSDRMPRFTIRPDQPEQNLRVAPAIMAAAACCFVFLVLRVPFLEHSMWTDEIYATAIAEGELKDVASTLRHSSTHPPLYYWSLHLWGKAVGTSDSATRCLSLVFGLVTLLAAAWLSGRVGGRGAGFTMFLLAASTYGAVWPHVEARNYAMANMWIVLAAASIIYGRDVGNRLICCRLIPGCLIACSMLTFYFSVFFLWIPMICLCWKGTLRKVILDATLMLGLAMLLWLPWAPAFIDQLQQVSEVKKVVNAQSVQRPSDSNTAIEVASRIVHDTPFVPLESVKMYSTKRRVVFVGSSLAIVAFCSLSFLRVYHEKRSSLMPTILLVVAGCLAVEFVASFTSDSVARYTTLRAVASCLVISCLLTVCSRHLRLGVVVLLVAANGLHSAHMLNDLPREDWRGTAAILASTVEPDHRVVTIAGFNRFSIERYWSDGASQTWGLPNDLRGDVKKDPLHNLLTAIFDEQDIPEFQELLVGATCIHVVLSHTKRKDLERGADLLSQVLLDTGYAKSKDIELQGVLYRKYELNRQTTITQVPQRDDGRDAQTRELGSSS